MLEQLKQIDQQLFLFLNSKHTPIVDQLMSYASGNKIWIPFYVFLLYWIFQKNKLKKFLYSIVAISITIALADQISVKLFKNVFMRYRPCHNMELSGLVHLVHNCGGQYGFVSSHASNVFGLAVLLSLIFKNSKITIILLGWASLVSYSRIYLGVHYPLDILGGAILGMVIGYFIYFVSNKIIQYE